MSRDSKLQRARRLVAAANEMLAIARDIELEIGDEEDVDATANDNPAAKIDDTLWGELARQAYRDRRRRNLIFGNDTLFGEPAWDILLDLFIAAKERQRVSISSACIGAAVPSSTALRWLTVLEELGLIVRESDPQDARRYFVALSTEGYAKMVHFFSEASRPVRYIQWDRTRASDPGLA